MVRAIMSPWFHVPEDTAVRGPRNMSAGRIIG